MKYDWSKAPGWAMFGLLTVNGAGYWCEDAYEVPALQTGWGLPSIFTTWKMKDSEILDRSGKWQDSLEKRPIKHTTPEAK